MGAAKALRIRPAAAGEAALVLTFVRELAGYEKLSHEVDANEAMIDAALFGPRPRAFCDIAEWAGEPVGFALWFMNFSSFRGRHGIYLEDIFVRPAHRGKGIGTTLLKHLAQRCVAEGWTRLEWAVLDWNRPAIDFYKAQGAALMDEWTVCRVSGPALTRLAGEDA
jgi:GNAT superfamily N-acetyltransferase